MSDAFYWGCESAHNAVGYLQTIRISEIRQTLELIGVHHIEVIAALLIFLMLQFTKFTAVLLLACLIAFSIFYMWDTWFPEESPSGSGNNNPMPGTYGAGYGPSFAPAFTPFNSELNYSYHDTPHKYNDARTSALFPPFSMNDNEDILSGDHTAPQEEKRNQLNEFYSVTTSNQFTPAARTNIPPSTRETPKRASVSGAATPIGHRGSTNDVRPNRRANNNQFEEIRYSRRPGERDPQAFRRMIANEYRAFRPGAAEPVQHHRYSPFDEQRMRRVVPPSSLEDTRNKNRRAADYRPSTPRKSNGTEQYDRQRTDSRDNFLRKIRNFPGPSSRSNGPNRPDPNSAHGTDNRGARRRSDYKSNMFKINRWIL